MLVVGVTGSIGAGKSTVSQMMADLGGRVLDADAIAREVLDDQADLVEELMRAFGEDILMPDGSLDRRELGRRAFRNQRSRERLNSLLHPPILRRIEDRLQKVRRSGYDGIVVIDAALLVECQALHLVDRLVVVTASEPLRYRRLRRDRRFNHEEFQARASAQLPDGEKIRLADYVIENQGTREDLQKQVRSLWSQLSDEVFGRPSSRPFDGKE
jgi:dephospho-CoA kinase